MTKIMYNIRIKKWILEKKLASDQTISGKDVINIYENI